MFPLFVDLTDRLGVVIGGGPVGRRKAKALLDARAVVRLVCLEPPPPDFAPPRLVWLQEPYSPDHLAGAALVFAAAHSQLNRSVVTDCRRRGLWVNCADDPTAGDFVVPATLHRGELTIAVGTAGSAPALAKRVRDRLEPQFDNSYAEWVEVLKEMRPAVMSLIAEEGRRRALLDAWADWPWLERLRRDGRVAVLAAMHDELRRTVGGVIE